jgi:N-acetylneuraminic acid mutarotase
MAVPISTGFMMAGGRKNAGSTATNDVWLTVNGTTWEQAPTAPFAGRAYHAMMNLKGCVYVMGGQKVGFLGNPFYNDVWKTCDNGKTWEGLGNAPWTTRAGIAFTVSKGKMLIAGGCYGGSIGKERKFLNDVWSSKNGKDWEQLTPNAQWSPRSGTRLVEFNDKLYVLAGEIGFTPDTQLADIWSSDDGKDWSLVTATPAFQGRSGHGVVVAGTELLVIAGWLNNKCLHDLWSSTDGVTWTLRSNNTWGCTDDECGKFDFWPVLSNTGSILTFGGSNAYSTFGKMWADTWKLPVLAPDAPPKNN